MACRRLTLVVLAAAMLISAGCSAQKRFCFNPENRSRINVIGLIKPSDPGQPFVLDHSAYTVGQHFGLVGALVSATMVEGDKKTRTEKFNQSTAHIPFDFCQQICDQMNEDLTQAGYTVKLIDAPKENPGVLLKDYTSLSQNADAYLDFAVVPYGFNKDLNIGKFIPRISLYVQLIEPGAKKPLYGRWFLYGPPPVAGTLQYVHLYSEESKFHGSPAYPDAILADETFYFTDIDHLIAANNQALQSLRIGTRKITRSIARSLAVHESRLVVYRPKISHKRNIDLELLVDDLPAGILANDSHLLTTLPAGSHAVTLSGPTLAERVQLQVDLEPGEVKYVKVEMVKQSGLKDWSSATARAAIVDPTVGSVQMPLTKGLLSE